MIKYFLKKVSEIDFVCYSIFPKFSKRYIQEKYLKRMFNKLKIALMERRDLFYKSVFTIKFDYEEREQKGIECYRSGVLGLSNA